VLYKGRRQACFCLRTKRKMARTEDYKNEKWHARRKSINRQEGISGNRIVTEGVQIKSLLCSTARDLFEQMPRDPPPPRHLTTGRATRKLPSGSRSVPGPLLAQETRRGAMRPQSGGSRRREMRLHGIAYPEAEAPVAAICAFTLLWKNLFGAVVPVSVRKHEERRKAIGLASALDWAHC
jgi:hypothetical protein